MKVHDTRGVALPLPPQADAQTAREGGDLYAALEAREETGDAIEELCFSGQDASYSTSSGLELKQCILRGCVLRGAQWKGASLVDVVLERCDLSNVRLRDLYAHRVRFVDCKLVGADLVGARLRSVSFSGCVLRMANLADAKLNTVLMERCDVSEAGLQGLKELKKLTLEECDLTRAELMGTPLAGVDLTRCTLDGILITGAAELRGAIVTPLQAVALSQLLGLVVRE